MAAPSTVQQHQLLTIQTRSNKAARQTSLRQSRLGFVLDIKPEKRVGSRAVKVRRPVLGNMKYSLDPGLISEFGPRFRDVTASSREDLFMNPRHFELADSNM
jgi:hypothetical protein